MLSCTTDTHPPHPPSRLIPLFQPSRGHSLLAYALAVYYILLSAMAAVVAHHPGLWHHSDQHVHFPHLNMSNFNSPYDAPQRTTTAPSVSRSFQTASSHIDMHGLPIYTPHTMANSMPYQQGAFAFDSLTTNPYNIQQAFPVSYPTSMPQSVPYSAAPEIQPLPTVRTARNGFASIRTSSIKSESASPAQPHHGYNELSYVEDYRRSASESSETHGPNFATDVDTLMKAIQAKQKTSPIKEPAKVCDYVCIRISMADSIAGRGSSTRQESVQTLCMPHPRLRQSVLPEDPSRHPSSSTHRRQAFCKSPTIRNNASLTVTEMQDLWSILFSVGEPKGQCFHHPLRLCTDDCRVMSGVTPESAPTTAKYVVNRSHREAMLAPTRLCTRR